jgi:hypothetical protein
MILSSTKEIVVITVLLDYTFILCCWCWDSMTSSVLILFSICVDGLPYYNYIYAFDVREKIDYQVEG